MTIKQSVKSALVTGANKGIGLEIARQLGERDYRVWLGCRDKERGETAAEKLRADGLDARAVVLNVASQESVSKAATVVGREMAALDVLVNNAGMHFGPPPRPSEESVDQMREMIDINALGAMRVTQAFLPLLHKSKSARIVMMSSSLGSLSATATLATDVWNVEFAGYCASKATLNMLTLKLAKDLMGEGIKVNAVDPGLTSTDLTGHMPGRKTSEAAVIAVRLATLDELGPTGGFFHDGYFNSPARHDW